MCRIINYKNMKFRHIFFVFIFLAAGLTAFGQVEFKEGYIVNNRQERTDCLIRNTGQEESASKYQYKLKNEKEITDIELSKIEEFGIDGELKCIRALIAIDVAPSRISSVKDTISRWEEGHAYLKVLVEGELATLYSYFDQGIESFFYRYPGSEIEPLIFKKFSLEITPNVVSQYFYNSAYVEQLAQNLACGDHAGNRNLQYTKKSLVDYFTAYYQCRNAEPLVLKSSQVKKGSLRFKLGVNQNIMQHSIEEFSDALPNVVFSKERSSGYSAEVEYLLPFNLYKWGFFAEANYYSYFSDKNTSASLPSEQTGTVVDYKTIEFPFGITHYMNLNRNNRLFVRAAFAPHLILKESYIAFSDTYRSGFSTASRALFGAGYNYNRVSVEFRYYTPQNITMNLYKRSSDLTQISFRLSYNLFETNR